MRKGQGAMEYLMTYGWALLIIIIVVIGLLAVMFVEESDETCRNDCEELDMEFWNYEHGGYASDECWCKIGRNPKQIW